MKATFDLPDDLYRSAKSRSALEGRTLRSVVIELFQQWLKSTPAGQEPEAEVPTHDEIARYPWLALSRRYIRPGMDHDLAKLREAAARGWGEDAAERIDPENHEE